MFVLDPLGDGPAVVLNGFRSDRLHLSQAEMDHD
jgi:hypothetical protein